MEKLKRYDLNCNIFDVYDYDGLSMQELLCQFFTKINECVETSNNAINLYEYLVNEGLADEVAIKLSKWLNDGTLEKLINTSSIEKLNNKINNVTLELNEKASKNEIFTMANMGQDIKEAMTGGSVAVVGKNSVLSNNVVDNQIGIEKTNYIKVNQLDFKHLGLGYFIGDNGNICYNPVGSANLLVFEVLPNRRYKVNVINNNRFRISCNRTLVYPKDPSGIVSEQVITVDDSLSEISFKTNNDIYYMYVHISQTYDESVKCQVYDLDGDIELDFTPKLSFINGGTDKAHLYKKYKSVYINSSNGMLSLSRGDESKYNTCNFKVKPNTNYRVIIKGENNRFKIGGFKNHLDLLNDKSINNFEFDNYIIDDNEGYYDNITFNSGICTDIWVYTSNDYQFYDVDVYEDGDLEIYGRKILDHNDIRKALNNISIKTESSNFRFFTKPEGFFNFKEIPAFDKTLKTNSYYELFDTLNYYSKETLGYETVSNLPINKYVFEPTFVDSSRDNNIKPNFRVPTVLISSTIHGGDEKLTCWIVYHFFKMLENTTDENLLWLKDNVRFVVVPMCNPWGFDNGVRQNGNGVDLNREFKKNEFEMQEESRLLKQLADNTIYDIHLDLHTMWEGNGKHTAWIISADDNNLSFDNNMLIYLSKEWKKRYSFMEQDNTLFGYIGQAEYIEPELQDTQFRAYSYAKGVKRATTLEIANTVKYNNEVRYGPLTTNLYFDLFVNYILGIIRTVL